MRRGSGISTTCYPAPAAIHGSLSSDKERLQLCLRVQTPAPILGRSSRNRSGHPGCVDGASPRGGDSSPTPQPPTSSPVVDPDGLTQTRWWVSPHPVTWGHVRFLRLRPAPAFPRAPAPLRAPCWCRVLRPFWCAFPPVVCGFPLPGSCASRRRWFSWRAVGHMHSVALARWLERSAPGVAAVRLFVLRVGAR